MNIKETKNEGLSREYKVSIPHKNFEEKVAKSLEKVAAKAKIQGFRPGKAPKALIEKQYKPSVVGEALEDLIQETTANLIKDKKIEPALMPDVKISKFEDGKDIEIIVSVEILPEIKIGDFSKIKINKYVAEVSPEEIENSLKYIAESRRETEKVKEARASVDGDTLVINFLGKVGGVAFEGGKGEKYPLVLGSNTFIPGFEAQLVGAKAGEKKDVNVKFPESYHAKDLAGKDSVFEVEVLEIRAPKKTEINDELAKSMGEKSLEELKAKIKERIAADYEQATKMKLKRHVLDAFDKEYNFEVPATMTKQEYDAIVKQYEEAKKNNQLDESEKNAKEKDILAEYKDIAVRRVKLGLLLSTIAKEAKIVVTADDVNKAIMAEARKYPGQEQAVMQYYLQNKDAVESLRAPIFEDKIIEHVLKSVNLVEQIVSVEDLYNFDENKPAKKAPAKKETAEKKEEKKPAAKKTAAKK